MKIRTEIEEKEEYFSELVSGDVFTFKKEQFKDFSYIVNDNDFYIALLNKKILNLNRNTVFEDKELNNHTKNSISDYIDLKVKIFKNSELIIK